MKEIGTNLTIAIIWVAVAVIIVCSRVFQTPAEHRDWTECQSLLRAEPAQSR